MRIQISILLFILFVSAIWTHGENNPPAEKCEFGGARADAAVRRISGNTPAPYYFACQEHNRYADESGCIKGSLSPGLIVTLDREEAGWACVTGGDSTSGWVERSRLEELPTEPKTKLTDWEGWWETGSRVKGIKNDRLLITRGAHPGSLRVSGRAYWYGLKDVAHYGRVNGEAVPVGNHLHVVEATDDPEHNGCVLDLTLVSENNTPELQARDNLRCGGANVSFRGTWHKFRPKKR